MQVVYAREQFPTNWSKSIFLAGPTPRSQASSVSSWRPEALRLLVSLGYDGVVFVPEDRDTSGCGVDPENYEPQIAWEDEGLRRADVILFWVPRDLSLNLPSDTDIDTTPSPDGSRRVDLKDLLSMPAFTTNIEWGAWFESGKVALGYPEKAPKMGYFHTKAKWLNLPIKHTLKETIERALTMIGDGAAREGGETHVPIEVWRTPAFQRWHAAQKLAHNVLLSARVLWTYWIGSERERLFFWAIETEMFIVAENRIIKDGVVLGRPDVSVTVLLGPDRGFNTEVVLIREFRPSAVTSDGFVHEPAGGSSWDDVEPAEVARAEAEEETGVSVPRSQFRDLGERQVMPSLSSHRAHSYIARLNKQQLEALRSRVGRPLGGPRDRDRTWVEFHTLRSLFEAKEVGSCDVDWSTLGMIFFGFYSHT